MCDNAEMIKEDYIKKNTYYYELPEELIAQTPLQKRDFSRMLVFNRPSSGIKESGEIKTVDINEIPFDLERCRANIEHKHFYDITDYFKAGDVLVLNNSRVLPARIFGIKVETGAKVEVLLQKRIDLHNWEIIARPTKRLKVGALVRFSDELTGTFTEIGEYGECKICFHFGDELSQNTEKQPISFEAILDRIGTMPLPPYIHEKLTEKERYQTVYSKTLGSSAAPTAGLHFTPEILQKLRDEGVIIAEVLLHVGLGTFRPVKEDSILDHKMHSEFLRVTPEVAKIVTDAKREGRRVIACGTTSMRTLESMASITQEDGRPFYQLEEGQKDTNIFIYPPYKFKMVDALITNFHLPESTLLMLISAFAGLENVREIYRTAIAERYRFFSFGDCCLLI